MRGMNTPGNKLKKAAMPEDDWATRSHVQTLVIMGATAAGCYLCYRLAMPFLPSLAWAIGLAILFVPFQRWVESKIRRPSLAAFCSVLVIGLIVVVPATFVVQQLVAQSGWTDPDLRFWHYRDKDQVEVDLVLTRGRHTWGVEVKASATVHESDGAGLRRLADQCGKDFQGGVLFYAGTSTLPLADPRFLAVPLEKLWTM